MSFGCNNIQARSQGGRTGQATPKSGHVRFLWSTFLSVSESFTSVGVYTVFQKTATLFFGHNFGK